jgi:hypothetical protein
MYPLAIATAHSVTTGASPESWQAAAQWASVAAGVLLVVPLYLVFVELFGASCAWLGCVLAYAVPLTGHVLADALSEGTFLLFWMWGLWAALRFLKEEKLRWLPLAVGMSGLAYLTRPEGLLLPAALVATLLLMPLRRATRMNAPTWRAAVGLLVIGPACVVGPFVAVKGGLGTKPAIARVLGTAPPSAPSAVERQKPLEPDQTPARTYVMATRALVDSVRDAVTAPLLLFGSLGIILAWRSGQRARTGLLVAIITVGAALALIRLHATGGYCSPRHTLVLAMMFLAAAGRGLQATIDLVARRLERRLAGFRVTTLARPALWTSGLAAIVAAYGSAAVAPVNAGLGAYRDAGHWLASHVPADARVVDVTGWSLFYSDRKGYTFRNVHEAFADPSLRWVVVREAHLVGPWGYCEQMRWLVAGRAQVASFPPNEDHHQTRVLVFDRARSGGPEPVQVARRREGTAGHTKRRGAG